MTKGLSLKGTLFKSEANGEFVLERKFETAMRIMFLPEEIRPVSAALGGEAPELDLFPVTEPLTWDDTHTSNDMECP